MKTSTTRIGALILLSGMGLSTAYASDDTFEEIKTRAYSDVLACESSNSTECLRKEEVYSPRFGDSYDGTPGWQVESPEERSKSGKNRNYEQTAEYYEDCYPGESGTDCELRLGDREQTGQNRNYDNDARYYGSDCYAGESESECRAREGQNTNYRNNAQYYGECNPEEEKCEGKGTNRNYQLNMDDFSGEGSDLYSGIPGGNQNNRSNFGGNQNNRSNFGGNQNNRSNFGGNQNNRSNFGGNQNSDLYRGIPGSSGDRNNIQTNNGQSWYQSDSESGSGNYSYGSVDSNGSFSGYGGSEADWETIDNKRAEFDQGLDQEFNEEGLYKDKEKTNWMMTLVFCHLQIPFEGVHKVYGDKTCRKSIKKLCSFKVSRMKVSGPSQCIGFAPWNM